ncbi:MAG TPA: hypothetical protein VM328_08975, partial [Fimbriimonadaceae bacterium]|nr:hypothetical protein [Fimbriimonadaceae bacterium]
MDEEDLVPRATLAALYLRGAPRSANLPKGNWSSALSIVRRSSPRLCEVPDALVRHGLRLEGFSLEAELLEWAFDQVLRGNVLTAACAGYPQGWLSK